MGVTVTAKKTENVEVVLSFDEVGRIAINALCEIYNIKEDYYIKDGGVWYDEEWYGHKTEWTPHRVRDATLDDAEGIEMVGKIRAWVYGKHQEDARKRDS